ncbi:MAG: Na(+)/H(+) antiporter subunit D [Verrucomicrobiales bacterium]
MISSPHPVIIIFAGALLVGVLRGRLKNIVSVLTPVLGLANLLAISSGMEVPGDDTWRLSVMDLDLVVARFDKLSLVFAYLFHIAAIITSIYSLHVRDNMQRVTGLLYAGSAIGAVLAGDLITLFVFWELLAVTSVFQIWARRTEKASGSGVRYLLLHVSSGLLLLLGAAILYRETDSLAFGEIGLEGPGGWLIFLALGIKCGFPLLHTWLTDSYPEATSAGAVYLCCFTTKTAVYAMARGFPGAEPLLYIGAVMAMFPIFYAVIENDLRRTLAYSMINQIGFMLVGIGLGTAWGINGAVAHAVNDVFFKGLLFMAMGAVLYRTGTMNASQLGGLYKSMPWTTGFSIVGAAAISGFPLLCGFVSKSMIMASAAKEGHLVIWLLLLFAAAGVLKHAGIKIPFFAFFAHDSGIRTREAPANMLVAMAMSAVMCIGIGCFPQLLYQLLPEAWDVAYNPYDTTHIINQFQLLFFAGAAFTFLMLRNIYPPELRSTNLDFDWTWRKGGRLFYRASDVIFNTANEKIHRGFVGLFIGRLNHLSKAAPSRLLVFVMTPLWKAQGFVGEALVEKQRAFYEDSRLGAFPIGKAAILAVILFGLLYIF